MPLGIFTIVGSVDSYENASQNAVTWNATLNGSATGFIIVPIFVIVIIVFVSLGFVATRMGFS